MATKLADNGNRPAPLVVRFGAFGDMILMVPMLKTLAERYGQPCDVVSSGPWTEPLLTRVSAVDRLVLLTSRRAPYWLNRSQRQLVRWLRQRGPGPVYVFEPDEKPIWLLNRAGISSDWICSIREFPRNPGEHIAEHALRLARQTPKALASVASPPSASFDSVPNARPVITDADRLDCQKWLEANGADGAPLVLVQPGNKKTMRRGSRQRGSNVKYWPEENWARVIEKVRKTLPDCRVLLCGTPAEQPLAEDIRRHCQCDGIVFATHGVIPRLLALLERAHSMISVDTGPAHAAAAMGCPLVVMFARVDPQYYAPQRTTAPVAIVRVPDPSGDTPMLSIQPDHVIDAWLKLPPRD